MDRGNVVIYKIPPPKGKPGREQHGIHRAIIIQDEIKFSSLPLTVIVPLTSKQKALRFETAFLIQPSAANSLSEPPIALPFQIRAIDRRRIIRVIGNIAEHDLETLERKIADLLQLKIIQDPK